MKTKHLAMAINDDLIISVNITKLFTSQSQFSSFILVQIKSHIFAIILKYEDIAVNKKIIYGLDLINPAYVQHIGVQLSSNENNIAY